MAIAGSWPGKISQLTVVTAHAPATDGEPVAAAGRGTLRAAEWAGSVECRQLGSSRRRRSVAGQLNADKPHYVKLAMQDRPTLHFLRWPVFTAYR